MIEYLYTSCMFERIVKYKDSHNFADLNSIQDQGMTFTFLQALFTVFIKKEIDQWFAFKFKTYYIIINNRTFLIKMKP